MPTEHSWPTRGLNEHVFQLLPVLADNVRKSEFVAWVHGHEEQPRSRAFVLQTVHVDRVSQRFRSAQIKSTFAYS